MIIETLNAAQQAHAAIVQASLPTGFSHTPTSVSDMVGGIQNAFKPVSDAAAPVLGGSGGVLAGYHAIAKASTKDPQKIQAHGQGIHNGIIGGLVGLGAGSIITIIAHIL